MMERGLPVVFCPSDCCADVSQDAGTDETLDGEDKLHRRDLLRAVDFYITVLAMARTDLRQPLQVIVGAHELLARRLTARPEREHLERSEQASAQLEEKLDQLVDALQLHQHARRIEPQPVRVEPILQRLALQLDGPARRKGVDFRFLPTSAVILSQPVLLDGILRNLSRNSHVRSVSSVFRCSCHCSSDLKYRGAPHLEAPPPVAGPAAEGRAPTSQRRRSARKPPSTRSAPMPRSAAR